MSGKKTVSLIALAAFLAFEWSCASIGANETGGRIREAVQRDISQTDTTNIKTQIFSVTKKGGKRILFPEGSPARFDPEAKAVVGVALQQFVFAKNEVEILRGGKRDVITSVRTADGRDYQVLSSLDEGENIRVNAYAPISIPLSDIERISIYRPNRGGNTLVILAVVAGSGVLWYIFINGILNGLRDIFK